MDSLKFISVVIPTYNRRIYLEECLKSFSNQTYPVTHFDVIVVDDGSTDGTEVFVNEYSKLTRINITYIRQENKGPAAARNLGIRHAKGELVAFTDDDCLPDVSWLEVYDKSFDNEAIGGVGGLVKPTTSGVIDEFMTFHNVLNPHIVDNEIIYLITANACYRRDVLIAISGFEEQIRNPGGEDPDLSMKVKEKGYKLKYDKDAVVYHHHRNDLKSFYRTFFNYGRGAHFLWSKWGDKLVKSPPAAIYRQILRIDNIKLIYSYYRYSGVKSAFQLWFLKNIEIIASTRGFYKGY